MLDATLFAARVSWITSITNATSVGCSRTRLPFAWSRPPVRRACRSSAAPATRYNAPPPRPASAYRCAAGAAGSQFGNESMKSNESQVERFDASKMPAALKLPVYMSLKSEGKILLVSAMTPLRGRPSCVLLPGTCQVTVSQGVGQISYFISVG